jgi:hypothetical protein
MRSSLPQHQYGCRLNADMQMVGTPCSHWPENMTVAVMMNCARQNKAHFTPYKLFDLCS